MTFFVAFVALVIERFLDWSQLRNWQWFFTYQHKLEQSLGQLPSYLRLIAILLPPLIIAGILLLMAKGWMHHLIEFILQFLILFYCLGPRNFWADTLASFYSVDQFYTQSLSRILGVIFWFALLGPIGALLYRMVDLLAYHPTPSLAEPLSPKIASARSLENILNWPVTRFFAFIFALGGRFKLVFTHWKKKVLSGVMENEAILSECGEIAIDYQPQIDETATNDASIKAGLKLIDRSLVIFMILLTITLIL